MRKIFIALIISQIVLLNLNLQAQTDRDINKFSRLILRNKTEKVIDLIKKGKNINSRNRLGQTPLLFSLLHNNSNMAEIFINAGADLNIPDLNELCSLHYAIQYCTNADIIYQLVEKGVDINHRNKELYTPFHFAVLDKCPEIPFYLIEKGADFRLISSFGENALHLSAISGCDKLFDYLLQQGLDYNLKDIDGNTPLMLALRFDRRNIAEKLLELGADVNVENNTHYTPIYYSIENEDTLNFNRLVEKGAKLDVAVEYVPPIYLAASKENAYFVKVLLLNGVENPMQCNIPDVCYQTAFVYFVNAGFADDGQKLGLYQNSINIFNLAREKYKNELNKIRAKNTAKVVGEGCLLFGAALSGSYYVGGGFDYEAERRDYLKNRIERCDSKIKEVQSIISLLK
jgi:uncharacterized protein